MQSNVFSSHHFHRYTTRVVFLPFQSLEISSDVSAHSNLSDMADAASAAMGLLIGLGRRLVGDIRDGDKLLQRYISEVATLLPPYVHERVLTGYALLLWFTDKVTMTSPTGSHTSTSRLVFT